MSRSTFLPLISAAAIAAPSEGCHFRRVVSSRAGAVFAADGLYVEILRLNVLILSVRREKSRLPGEDQSNISALWRP